jgi:hypothetical protein
MGHFGFWRTRQAYHHLWLGISRFCISCIYLLYMLVSTYQSWTKPTAFRCFVRERDEWKQHLIRVSERLMTIAKGDDQNPHKAHSDHRNPR